MHGGQILAAGISQSDWPFNSRAVNGSKLSARLFSIRPPWPRNKSAEVNVSLKDILVVLGELSSFLSLLRMASGLTQAVSHSEQRSTATVKYVSRFIVACLQIFI